jgi:hypothetical protein
LVSVSGFASPLPVTFSGNVTLSNSQGYIGLVTSTQVGLVTTINIGLTTLAPSPNYIGLVTVANTIPVTFAGNVTLDAGSKTQLVGTVTIQDGGNTISTDIIGNVTISDSKGFIGLTTAVNGQAWPDPKTYIGLVTVTGSLSAAAGNITLDAGSKTGIIGNVTISDSKGFIGLVTAVVAFTPGTGKTLTNLPISFLSAGSQATIVVPGTNTAVYITNMLLNSDATVRVNIKSGVTYLTGNASVGITLNPGGGFVMSGSVDSPVWIGLPSGALIVEKLDLTATSAKIGGNVVYFQQ